MLYKHHLHLVPKHFHPSKVKLFYLLSSFLHFFYLLAAIQSIFCLYRLIYSGYFV
jgi:hypothetical protein